MSCHYITTDKKTHQNLRTLRVSSEKNQNRNISADLPKVDFKKYCK